MRPYPGTLWRSRLALLVVLVLAGTGAWISGELLKRQADVWSVGGAGGGVFERVCRVAQPLGWDCAAIPRSPWADFRIAVPVPVPRLTWRVHWVMVPMAFVGLSYFVFLAIWFAVLGRPAFRGPAWECLPLWVATVGVAVSGFCLALMVIRWVPPCVWCVAVHAVNLLLFLTVQRLCRTPHPRVLARVPASRPAVCAGVFAVVVIAGLWVYRQEHLAMGARLRALVPYKELVTALRDDPPFLLREFYAQPKRTLPAEHDRDDGGDGPRLVVFTDFECSACTCNARLLRQQVEPLFGGQLTLEVRHYPLSDECNAAADGPTHPNACTAAYAAEAARRQGGDEAFRRMHDLLFENRRRLGPALYRELALQIGLDAELLMADLGSDAVRRIVETDVALARELGVQATPTMFFNGRRIGIWGSDNAVFWQALGREWSAGQEQAAVVMPEFAQ